VQHGFTYQMQILMTSDKPSNKTHKSYVQSDPESKNFGMTLATSNLSMSLPVIDGKSTLINNVDTFPKLNINTNSTSSVNGTIVVQQTMTMS